MSFNKKLSDIIDFNPKRPIKKGEAKPFIEMAALSAENRDVSEFVKREFKGGGSKFKNGDTLFARITPCLQNGKTTKVSCLNQDEHGHGSTEFIVMSAKEPKYDEDYVYYLARHPEFRAYAELRMEGTSGRQRVAWQSLAEFEFDYPDKKIRKKAGKFLKEIDDNIALNSQTNQTLESIAQALFESWFVDFAPVKAKIEVLLSGGSTEDAELAAMSLISSKSLDELAELKQTNPDNYEKLTQTAALFPSAMQKSELEEIPKGWSVENIKSFCDVTDYVANGSFASLKKNVTYLKAGYAIVVRLTDYKSGWSGGFNYVDEHAYNFLKKSSVSPGDVIISNVGAYAGTVFRAVDLESPMTLGPNSILLKSELTRLYLYYHFTSHLGKHQLDGIKGGSAQPKFNKTDFRSLRILKPSIKILTEFNKLIGSFENLSANNEKSNRNLSNLRDVILPGLLSGEILED